MKHTIDATDQKLGRVASKAAVLLMGKNLTSYQRNTAPTEVTVEITNASKSALRFDHKKMRASDFAHYSGYPGSLRFETMEQIAVQKGYGEIFRQAVRGMLPSNKLRAGMMKRLIVTE